MTSPNTGLTDEQRMHNRLRWLLIESAAAAEVPATTGVVDAMAKAMATVLRDNGLVLTWLSDFEKDVAS